MSRGVTGIGGIFFTCPDPDELRAWYLKHLGLAAGPGGGIWFEWLELERDRTARTVLGPFAESTEYFEPSTKPFMVNYRVDDLDGLLGSLEAAGERVVGPVLESEEGRFAWVLDPDGNKVELWEPAVPSGATLPRVADVTGIGGVFFTAPDPPALKAWYAERLGLWPDDQGYVTLAWRTTAGDRAYLSWEIFPDGTDYFEPSTRPFMLNLRVRDLAALRDRLAASGEVPVDPNTEEYEYGKFGWILDPAGTRLELWEPDDRAFD